MSKTCSKSQEELFNSFFHFKWGVFALYVIKFECNWPFCTTRSKWYCDYSWTFDLIKFIAIENLTNLGNFINLQRCFSLCGLVWSLIYRIYSNKGRAWIEADLQYKPKFTNLTIVAQNIIEFTKTLSHLDNSWLFRI